MIFASVGSMLPFDRLVEAVDQWAGAHPAVPVFIQIGDGRYLPRHAQWARMMPHADYRARLHACRLFVAHVGMGSILQGLEARTPMLLMPRRPEQGEHTTDHQRHTARRFVDTPGIRIIDDEAALPAVINAMLRRPIEAAEPLPPFAAPPLLAAISNFLAPERRS